jgi:hypothetical protein
MEERSDSHLMRSFDRESPGESRSLSFLLHLNVIGRNLIVGTTNYKR